MANIVLAHGILGFSGIGVGDFTFINYFNGVKDSLEAQQHRVFAPQVNPVGSIKERASELTHAIIKEYEGYPGNPQLIILGHSMGGLDARQALLDCEQLALITDSLVTIGTPHLGSPIANLIAEEIDFTNIVYKTLLKLLGDSVGGLKDLTEEFGEHFDQVTPNREGVRYFSIAGKAGKNSSMFFRALGATIAGVDDGAVPYKSAYKSGNGWTALADWPVDHVGEIGWFDFFTPKSEFENHLQRYRELVDFIVRSRPGG